MSILVTDELENLKLYHYDTCDINSNSDLQSTRGIIKDNSVIVCKTNGFIPEVRTDDTENISKWITPNLNKSQFFESHEGSIVRLWYYSENPDEKKHRWFLSTHKRIDAFSSKWGSRTTYGETFVNFISKLELKSTSKSWADISDSDEEETNGTKETKGNNKYNTIFKDFCGMCNKNLIYNFLIRNTNNNRVVIRGYTEPEIFCLGTYDKTKNFKFVVNCNSDNNKKQFIIPPPPVYNFKNLENTILDIDSFDIYKFGGVLLVTNDGNMIKLINTKYDTLFKLRGNVPNISVRYLELRNKDEQKSEYMHLYSECIDEFKDMEIILNDISKNIFKKYLARFVYKQFTILPPIQYKYINKIHQLYKDKTVTKVTLDEVIKFINNLSSSELYNLIKNYRINKREYGNGNFVSNELKKKIISDSTNQTLN
jgi:hypothetical protein